MRVWFRIVRVRFRVVLAAGFVLAAVLAAGFVATGCSYKPAFRDCDIACNAPTDCPDDFTCGPEQLCRASGVTATCAAVRDARDNEDANPKIDAPPMIDAAIDAPPGPSEFYGCYSVPDNTYTCTQICASDSKTCSTGCNTGKVWYAYSLAGPCAASQPTQYTGTTCSQKAVIGTGDTIYVQCCCQ